MKKSRVIIFLLSIISMISHAETKTQDLNGIWQDTHGPEFDQCYLIIAQQGAVAHMTHYLEFQGTPMVEFGSGKVAGNKVTFKVKVSKSIPGWATAGTHYLQLSDDGNTLKGEYKDTRGNKGPLVFTRLRKNN